jgi:glutaminyl-peptide cyclotransferase
MNKFTMPTGKWLFLSVFGLVIILITGVFTFSGHIKGIYQDDRSSHTSNEQNFYFDGKRAIQDVEYQVDLGPRLPGSYAHDRTIHWISDRLSGYGWDVTIQKETIGELLIRNVVAKIGQGKPWLLIGAHYDTRIRADRDPDINKQSTPVPGANDGASGVSVLLELGRILPGVMRSQKLSGEIWLVFFDAEDNGDIDGYSWAMGSEVFVKSITEMPDSVVIIDMIGDSQLEIYKERNSNPELTEEIWSIAKSLGYEDYFLPEYKYKILDDHIPFINEGARAIDIIDFDYPYWHTTSDTADKISIESLRIVGDTILVWLQQSLRQE